MSTVRVTHFTIRCDGTCGQVVATGETSALGARIAMAAKGWRYAEGRLSAPGMRGQRQFDYCAECWPSSPHARSDR